MPRRTGVCSWSLRPESPEQLVEKLGVLGLRHVQLALGPLRLGVWKLGRTLDALRLGGIQVCSGMIGFEEEDYSSLESIRETGGLRQDRLWRKNLKIASKSARLAAELGLKLVSFHAGFLPHDSSDPTREILLSRLREVIDLFAERGVRTALETGQESAGTLLDALYDLDRTEVGVNFDPANMLLYGMGDPVQALDRLAPRVFQLHIKDARATRTPGTWGQEVPVGDGEVDWTSLFDVLDQKLPQVDLMIEREAGADRVQDIGRAADLIRAQEERLASPR